QLHAVALDARARLDGADGAVVVAHRDGGQVLDLDRGGERAVLGVDAPGLQAAEVAHRVDVVDAGCNQHAATGARLGGAPVRGRAVVIAVDPVALRLLQHGDDARANHGADAA